MAIIIISYARRLLSQWTIFLGWKPTLTMTVAPGNNDDDNNDIIIIVII